MIKKPYQKIAEATERENELAACFKKFNDISAISQEISHKTRGNSKFCDITKSK
jgi:hypothetical protein